MVPLQHQPTASQAKNAFSISNTGGFSSAELSSSPEVPGSGHVPHGQLSSPTAHPGVDDQQRQQSKVLDVSTAQPEQLLNIAHPTIPPEPTTSEINTLHDKHDFFNGVIDPVPGNIYQAFYRDAHNEGWWMYTPLLWDAWERHIGIKFSIWQANLFHDLPDCYRISRVRTKAKGRKMNPVKCRSGWCYHRSRKPDRDRSRRVSACSHNGLRTGCGNTTGDRRGNLHIRCVVPRAWPDGVGCKTAHQHKRDDAVR